VKQPILYIKDSEGNYQQIEMFSDETITITSKIQDVRDISKVFTDFTKPFTIPASKENNKLFQHWYNYDIDNGFDNRIKKDALLEINYSPYKSGKIQLESVNLKDNKPYSYSVIFYGNTVELGTLMGDDKLDVLVYLDNNYNHPYNSTNVRLAVRNGLFSQSIIYPLISHTKRFYYDSTNRIPQFSGNLYHDSTNPSDNQGVSWLDVKPAVKCLNIVEAIEDRYNITFTRDFFGTAPFSNLYLWLSRNKGKIGGDDDILKTRLIGDWTYTGTGSNPFNVSGNLITFSVVKNTNSFTVELDITTTDTGTYTLKLVDIENDVTLIEEDNLQGSTSISEAFLNTGSHQLRFILESTESISFDADLTVEEVLFTIPTQVTTANYEANGISTTEEIIITDNVPEIKNIDFLTGIFKMFNLTAYYIDDVADSDFGKIYVDTLDNYYADAINNPSSGSYNISNMVDISNTNVDAPVNYSGVDFKYQEPSTLLAINHKEQFNDVFGDERVRASIDKAEIYSVETPFEHMKFERLFDDNKSSSSPYHTGANDTYLTDILWGYSADGEFSGDYVIKVQGSATNTLSNKLKDTSEDFTKKNLAVGDIIRNLTNNKSALITALDSADTLSVSNNVFSSGDNYMILEDYTQGNYEPTLTKPLIFYGIRESQPTEDKAINWISGGQDYLSFYFRPSNTNEDGTSSTAPSHTINFDNEVDEWNLKDYGGDTNSLFKKFYKEYIEDIFDPKKRMYKVKAYLTTEVFLNMRLNDRFIINNRVFIINSIKTNLKTELSEIELLNVVDNELPS